MITQDRMTAALHGLQAALVIARAMALERDKEDLYAVLDMLEYLPCLMLEKKNRTQEFLDQLVGLSERWPEFKFAVTKYELACTGALDDDWHV